VQYSVDGSSTVNIRQNGALGNMNPSSELISEFKVTQFNNNAEFAQLLGGPRLSISRNGCGCALKARLQIYSIIRTLRHRQRT
jgi:hypothetical protein